MDREILLGLAAKNEAMGRASIVEHSQLFAAFHPFALLDGDLAGRHLNHAHCDETHQSDIRVVGFDENEGPGVRLVATILRYAWVAVRMALSCLKAGERA